MLRPNVLLIAGTGTKSGKTTLACRIIEQFRHLKPVAVKISPHFHEVTPGLVPVHLEPAYSIYRESDNNSVKDTSRMLRSGAGEVYFAQVHDDRLAFVFEQIYCHTGKDSPVICESPALGNYVEPGVLLIITSESAKKYKDISQLLQHRHQIIRFEELGEMKEIPVDFINGGWIYK